MGIASTFNLLFGSLTVIAQIAVVVLVVLVVTKSKHLAWVRMHALSLGFLIALIATTGSLLYSEVAGYVPCTFCWYQRIFMYPQVILLGIASLKKDRNMLLYGLVLSGVGAFVALYHYLLQLGFVPSAVCNAVGASVSCSQRFVMTYGYITIPMMALSAFVLMALILWIGRRSSVE